MDGVGAIDLLLSIKPDAEPLHQVAVAALLRHSPLLRRLGVLPGEWVATTNSGIYRAELLKNDLGAG